MAGRGKEFMKRWAVLTVILYLLALVSLTVPALLVGLGRWWGSGSGPSMDSIVKIYQSGGYWIWIGIMALGQALLLLVPISIAQRRLPARRRLLVPVLTTAFFLMALLVTGTFSLLCVFFHDDAFKVFDFYNWLAGINRETSQAAADRNAILGFITIVAGCWAVWALIFFRATRADGPETLMKRAVRWLLRGSILELLVAVPSHIVVRHRQDCCAPAGTFWGITSGLSIMLLCFGPGVFFLFAERIQRLRPKPPADSPRVPQAAG
jgi:hypothetical protein